MIPAKMLMIVLLSLFVLEATAKAAFTVMLLLMGKGEQKTDSQIQSVLIVVFQWLSLIL